MIIGGGFSDDHTERCLKLDCAECVCVCERWTVAEHVDGWMCACSPMSRRYAAQSSTAIKRAKAWMLRPEEQGPESFGRQVLN